MQDIAPIKLAIDLGHLLKIDYTHKAHPINAGVIRPLRFNNKGKLTAYNYDSSSERILDTKHITDILHFQPQIVDGNAPSSVQDFRWLISKSVVPLWEHGWLISVDEEYLGIYPRTKDDTTETNKGYIDQFAYLQYIKSTNHQFHTWFKDGHYLRYDAFDDALNSIMTYATKHPVDTHWTL